MPLLVELSSPGYHSRWKLWLAWLPLLVEPSSLSKHYYFRQNQILLNPALLFPAELPEALLLNTTAASRNEGTLWIDLDRMMTTIRGRVRDANALDNDEHRAVIVRGGGGASCCIGFGLCCQGGTGPSSSPVRHCFRNLLVFLVVVFCWRDKRIGLAEVVWKREWVFQAGRAVAVKPDEDHYPRRSRCIGQP